LKAYTTIPKKASDSTYVNLTQEKAILHDAASLALSSI